MTTWHYPKAHAIGYRSILIDAGDRILGELDADLAAFAKTKLEGRGVEVRLKSRVAEVTGDRVFTDDGLDILTGTVISTIGNEQHPLVKQLGLPWNEDGFSLMIVCASGFSHGLGAGRRSCGAGSRNCPPTAQYAVRQGQECADNILASIRGDEPLPFRYKGKGQFAIVGKHCGIAQIGSWKVSGVGAWLLWRTVYLGKRPGLRCRVRVAMDWLLDVLFPRDINKIEVRRTTSCSARISAKERSLSDRAILPDCFYLIESGNVEVVHETPGKQPECVRVCSAGDTFGEVTILKNAPRTATVRCMTAVDVLKFGREDFLSMFGGCKALRTHIEDTLEKYVT